MNHHWWRCNFKRGCFVFVRGPHKITRTGGTRGGIVKQIPVGCKTVITVKLIAPIAWIFDRGHVTVVAFSAKNPVECADDSISSSAFHTVSLSISLSRAHTRTHMLIGGSHLHPNDFTLPFYPPSDPSIKLSATRAPSRRLCVGVCWLLCLRVCGPFYGGYYLVPKCGISIVWRLISHRLVTCVTRGILFNQN